MSKICAYCGCRSDRGCIAKFHHLAHDISKSRPQSQETTVALRKLLEAKDAAG